MICTTCPQPSSIGYAKARPWYLGLIHALLRFAHLRESAHLRLIPFTHAIQDASHRGVPSAYADGLLPRDDEVGNDQRV